MTSTQRTRTSFVCTACGHEAPKWQGRCQACGAWGSYEERVEPRSQRRVAPRAAAAPSAEPALLSEHAADGLERRSPIGLPQTDALLGGGLVAGSALLLAGDPGVGKSTLLLQVCARLAERGSRVLYASGEESAAQVRLRAERLGAANAPVLFVAETDADALVVALERARPAAVVVDSVQTLWTGAAASGAGSVAQVRESAALLTTWAKANGAPLFLAGHVTKDGAIAGPRTLEHMVDVVLQLEGDPLSQYRILRCAKNRFGATNDLALFEMRGDGLAEVPDPSAALIAGRAAGAPGSAVTVALEGSRPLLAEVQALTNGAGQNAPRRTATGVDFNRMVMLAAVLSRRGGLRLGDQDVMVNVPGGLRIAEPAADLAIALAVASSFRDLPLDPRAVLIGEVGLNGEVRRVPQLERRLAEAARHGFARAIVPAVDGAPPRRADAPAIEAVGVNSVREAIGAAAQR